MFASNCGEVKDQLAADVRRICATSFAFAAMKADRSVVAWGDKRYGGDCIHVQTQIVADVRHICSTNGAFAALKIDGGVVAWGVGGGNGRKMQGIIAISNIMGNCGTFY